MGAEPYIAHLQPFLESPGQALVCSERAEGLSEAGREALASWLVDHPEGVAGYAAFGTGLASSRCAAITRRAHELTPRRLPTLARMALAPLHPLGLRGTLVGPRLDVMVVDFTDPWAGNVTEAVDWLLSLALPRATPGGSFLLLAAPETPLVAELLRRLEVNDWNRRWVMLHLPA